VQRASCDATVLYCSVLYHYSCAVWQRARRGAAVEGVLLRGALVPRPRASSTATSSPRTSSSLDPGARRRVLKASDFWECPPSSEPRIPACSEFSNTTQLLLLYQWALVCPLQGSFLVDAVL